MDNSIGNCQKARRNIKIADHMANVIYPVVKERKMLLSAIENIFLAASYSMSALLHNEREFKRLPPFDNSFDSWLEIFKNRCCKAYKIEQKYISFIEEIKDLLTETKRPQQQNGPIIMMSKKGAITTVEIKQYISTAKEFSKRIEEILAQNGPYARM